MASRRELILGGALGTSALLASVSQGRGAGSPPADAMVRPASMLDVRAFGAVGDGQANDTAAIQAAIDEAIHRGGGLVYLPAGRYKIVPQKSAEADDPARCGLVIAGSNVTLAGDGMDATTLIFRVWGDKDPSSNWQTIAPNAGQPAQLWRGHGIYILGGQTAETTTRNTTLRDFTYDGGVYPGNTKSKGFPANVQTGDGWDLTHKGVCVEPDKFHDNIVIERCHLHNWRGEILYGGGEHIESVRISHCRLHSTNGDAISFSAALEVQNCELSDCAHAGVESFNLSKRTVYLDNIVQDVDVGINIQTYHDSDSIALIRNNAICRARLFGVLLNVENGPTEISDNLFVDAATGSINAAVIAVTTGRGVKQPIITNIRIARNRIVGDRAFNGTGISLTCFDPAAELNHVTVDGNTIERSATALALGNEFKIPIGYNFRTGKIANVTISNNRFFDVSRDIENTEPNPAHPAPLMVNNRAYRLRERGNTDYATNGVDETLLKNEICFLSSSAAGQVATPVLDARRYSEGQAFTIGCNNRARPVYFPISDIYHMRQGRFVAAGTYLTLRVSNGRFVEVGYIDERDLRDAEIGDGPVLAMNGYDTAYLSPKTAAKVYSDFSGVGDRATIRLVARAPGITIKHGPRIQLKGQRDRLLAPLEAMQFFRIENGPLIEL